MALMVEPQATPTVMLESTNCTRRRAAEMATRLEAVDLADAAGNGHDVRGDPEFLEQVGLHPVGLVEGRAHPNLDQARSRVRGQAAARPSTVRCRAPARWPPW